MTPSSYYLGSIHLERTGALVPRREYQLQLEINPEDPLAGAIVTALIPVDPEIKKHFEASMKAN
ncbi:hypothetical protein CXZ08_20880 [Vibrio parahaemolyticus]|nr:hypothetical protein C1S89_23115 [Vibrio parahaemolyticus]PMS46016.1 hypothetical protein C1T11_23970 [Vibrio parahaemolyticus]PMS58547.1 hypothetical protein C1T09_09585 [Vibrio parahaemolyticus]PMS82504.1 hypothetical protein C1S90_23105 [Vibrio parahaemolyticus]PMS91875.1 hypothetical protein C1T06_23475 [Vibrio parahaemolyticus]